VSQGHLIIFEGMDGSGKSTLAQAVLSCSTEQGWWLKPPTSMAFPSHDGEVGKLIRRVFSGDVQVGGGIRSTASVLGYLMVADAVDIEPMLLGHIADGTSVLCDRHATVSGWAYQRECWSTDQILAIQQREQFHRATVTFILDVPVVVAMERINLRGSRNPIYEMEGIPYVSRLRARYVAYAAMHDDVVVLDGTRPIDQLIAQVHSHLKQRKVLV